MKSSHLKNLLRKIDIKKYIDENLSKPDITHKVQDAFYANGWDAKDITPYIIDQFIEEEFDLIINPDKVNRKAIYWVKNNKSKNKKVWLEVPGQITMDIPNIQTLSYSEETDSDTNKGDEIRDYTPSKEIDLQSKVPNDIQKSHLVENSITLESINNNVETLFKNLGKLKSEIKAIKRINNIKIKEENRAFIEEMLKILGGTYETQSININNSLLKDVKELLNKEYGIKDDIGRIINAALVLVVYGRK